MLPRSRNTERASTSPTLVYAVAHLLILVQTPGALELQLFRAQGTCWPLHRALLIALALCLPLWSVSILLSVEVSLEKNHLSHIHEVVPSRPVLSGKEIWLCNHCRLFLKAWSQSATITVQYRSGHQLKTDSRPNTLSFVLGQKQDHT